MLIAMFGYIWKNQYLQFKKFINFKIVGNYRIPPALLDNPQLIMIDVKIAVIQCARRWPLYFSVQFPVMDQFINRVTNEVVNTNRILAVHESGLTYVFFYSYYINCNSFFFFLKKILNLNTI